MVEFPQIRLSFLLITMFVVMLVIMFIGAKLTCPSLSCPDVNCQGAPNNYNLTCPTTSCPDNSLNISLDCSNKTTVNTICNCVYSNQTLVNQSYYMQRNITSVNMTIFLTNTTGNFTMFFNLKNSSFMNDSWSSLANYTVTGLDMMFNITMGWN